MLGALAATSVFGIAEDGLGGSKLQASNLEESDRTRKWRSLGTTCDSGRGSYLKLDFDRSTFRL
jgi:hypothetical protein